MPYTIVKREIVQGGSIARTPCVDPFLDEKDLEILYMRWRYHWPEPLVYQGNQVTLTCGMIAEVPEAELVKTYGKQRTARILEAIQGNY